MASVDKKILNEALKLLRLKKSQVTFELNLDKVRKKAYAKWHPDKVAGMQNLTNEECKQKTQEYEEKCKNIPEAIKIIERYLQYGEYNPSSTTQKQTSQKQESKQPPPQEQSSYTPPEKPKLHINPEIIDFGILKKGETRKVTIHVSNVGTGTLNWKIGFKSEELEIQTTYNQIHITYVHNQDKAFFGGFEILSNGGTKMVSVSGDYVVPKFFKKIPKAVLIFGLAIIGIIVISEYKPFKKKSTPYVQPETPKITVIETPEDYVSHEQKFVEYLKEKNEEEKRNGMPPGVYDKIKESSNKDEKSASPPPIEEEKLEIKDQVNIYEQYWNLMDDNWQKMLFPNAGKPNEAQLKSIFEQSKLEIRENVGVTTLEPLQYFKNVNKLLIYKNPISSFSSAENTSKITNLVIHNPNMQSMHGLSNFQNLSDLYIGISCTNFPTIGLNNLKSLYLKKRSYIDEETLLEFANNHPNCKIGADADNGGYAIWFENGKWD